ncbi:kelch domain-containing protein 9-like [Ostrea edulis]|uniref:kelch domain-containing protein 9-like n=1 Tax=Ostrea edulis TaxID=37623 RepID=UPI0020951F13|nr:kelch domain-containing protein 9-like [Ostrea edulis]
MSKGRKFEDNLLVDWEIFCPIGPKLAFHVACVLGNALYVHGGIEERYSTQPSKRLFKLNFDTMIWNEVRVGNSPALSHHACVPLAEKCMVLIGGWNGKCRTSSVVIFDAEKEEWIYPNVTGFPDDAGLSSHTASLLSDGGIIVIGREGTLRMQPGKEYTGNVYMLKGSLESNEFRFEEYSRLTESRSGHTTNFIGPTLYIIGGRSDQLLEVHKGYRSGYPKNNLMEKIVTIAKSLPPLSKMPGGRKYHVAIEGPSTILIHGGETFRGQNSEPVGEILLMSNKPNINFYKVGTSKVVRAGHACCISHDRILFHGGFSGKGLIHGDTRELRIL